MKICNGTIDCYIEFILKICRRSLSRVENMVGLIITQNKGVARDSQPLFIIWGE